MNYVVIYFQDKHLLGLNLARYVLMNMGNIGRLHRCIREYYQDAPYDAIIPVEAVVNLPGLKENYIKANLLEYCGNLEMRTAKLKEAEKHYKEAEELYRQIQYDLGLANVLQAEGDLLQKRKEYRNAIDVYIDAIELYEKIDEMIGLAYTNSKICYCYAKKDDADSVFAYAEKVIRILEKVPYASVKSYCNNKIRSALELIS